MGSPTPRERALVASHTAGKSSRALRKHMRDLSTSDKGEGNHKTQDVSEEEEVEEHDREYDDDEVEEHDREYDDDEEDMGATGQQVTDREIDIQKEMQHEKSLYPGAKTWASEEEKLFELLFMRQDLPILPAHWEVDFRNVPIGEANFSLSEDKPPLIYAHGKEFLATTALVRLIDLTAAVRTLAQSGLRHKAPSTIKKGIDQYLAWAVEDGGYRNRKVVPNIVNEIIDSGLPTGEITQFMQKRMRALARLQRDFLRVDRDPSFWSIRKHRYPGDEESPMRNKLLLQKYLSPRGKRNLPRHMRLFDDELAEDAKPPQTTPPKKVDSVAKRWFFFSSPAKQPVDELAEEKAAGSAKMLTPPRQTPQREDMTGVEYRNTPPVVYGFFIYNTSVFVLTTDSSKGEDAYVSFHVETDFMNKRQCVWNALTLGMVTCLARDELKKRMSDFAESDTGHGSDPDI